MIPPLPLTLPLPPVWLITSIVALLLAPHLSLFIFFLFGQVILVCLGEWFPPSSHLELEVLTLAYDAGFLPYPWNILLAMYIGGFIALSTHPIRLGIIASVGGMISYSIRWIHLHDKQGKLVAKPDEHYYPCGWNNKIKN